MKHQHTARPWGATFADDASMSDGRAGWVIDSAKTIGCLAVVRGSGVADEPNARLIAAAPQMFDALLALLTARKESSERFRRVSYNGDVQAALDLVESIAEDEAGDAPLC